MRRKQTAPQESDVEAVTGEEAETDQLGFFLHFELSQKLTNTSHVTGSQTALAAGFRHGL